MHRVDIRPRLTGKTATFFQMITVVWAMAGRGSSHAFIGLAMIAALFTLISGLQYVLDGVRQVEHHAHPTPHPK